MSDTPPRISKAPPPPTPIRSGYAPPLKTKKAKPPNWEIWGNLQKAELWELVCLSCNVEPQSYHQDRGRDIPADTREIIENRMFLAERIASTNSGPLLAVGNLAAGGGFKTCHFSFANFTKWAESLNPPWELPDEFPRFEETKEELPISSSKWPWGDYETQLLTHLADAAREWWSTYDPGDPTTAPTNNDVKNWLISQGVSSRVSEVMAQILRADGLPTGPRK